jgi:hypothetical protein
LQRLFQSAGFAERWFAKLDDCRTFGRWRILNRMELSVRTLLHHAGLSYPESCLAAVYKRLP